MNAALVAAFMATNILATTSLPASAGDGSHVTIKWKSYDVSGSTAGELRARMKQDGPRHFYGLTKPVYGKAEHCYDLVIKITLPNWSNKDMAPARLQRRWERMSAALKRHELNHVRHFRNASAEMQEKGCENAGRIKAKWQAVTDLYDRMTFHGAIEGAYLF